jgi:motility quorum-sensing regulator / GCU-specific mRNA interferase toxin
MEKQIAHYDLKAVKVLVTTHGIDAFTLTALHGIDAMALTLEQGLQVVLNLERIMFFKSMTTHSDHRVWQDVYHAPCPNDKTAYIKVTIQDGATVIQFKER